jgi:hypothetical protein
MLAAKITEERKLFVQKPRINIFGSFSFKTPQFYPKIPVNSGFTKKRSRLPTYEVFLTNS